MDPENPIYKTAELVRDAVGCYYFICLQCGKDFENLDDTVEHIEKYFYEPTDDNSTVDLLTPMTINESDWMATDGDVETVVANIKKESFEEYEDYKLSIPQMQQVVNEPAKNEPIFCPLCSTTLSLEEISLESHLMKVHHRSRNHAKIYECKICGRNTFTRSYDLERHELIHARYVDELDQTSMLSGSEYLRPKRKAARNENSVLFNILNQSDKESIAETFEKPNIQHHHRHSTSSVQSRGVKRYMPVNDLAVERTHKQAKPMEQAKPLEQEKPLEQAKPLEVIDNEKMVASRQTKANTSNYCSICQATCSKNETLESHLIRVHRRNKQYAKVYECDVCGKNTFTRPYDLRRHELIHLARSRQDGDGTATVPNKVIKTEPKTDDKVVISPVPLTRPLTIKPEAKSVTEGKPTGTKIRTTNPQKNGVLCAVCNEKFDSYFDVTMHLKFAHNHKKVYKCSHLNCNADSFSNSFLLHRHEISHSVHYPNIVGNNQNRMKCIFCRRSFNKKWNLLKHEKRHLLEMSQQ